MPQGEEAAAQEGVVERQQEPYAGAFSIALKITNEKLTACIDNLIGQVEDDFLKNGSLQRIVTDFVGNLLDGKVDEEHTVFDVVETVYQMHLAGNEGVKAWDEEEKPEENNGGNTGENNEGTTDPNGNNHGTVVKPAQKVIPKTGDQTPLVVTSVLLFGSAAVLLMSMLRKKNK